MRPSTSPVLLAAIMLLACNEDPAQGPDPARVPGSVPEAGLVLHVESDEGVTLAGPSVARWADRSMFKNDGSPLPKAPAPAHQTLAGRPTLRFAGDAGPMDGAQGVAFQKQISGASGITSFALVRVQDPGAPLNDITLSVPELQGIGSAEPIGVRASVAEGVLNLHYSAGGDAIEANLPALGRWTLVSAVHAPDGDVRLFADGTMIARGSAGAPSAAGRVVVLSGGLTSAETAALLVYDRALSDAERASVEGYLERKWQYR